MGMSKKREISTKVIVTKDSEACDEEEIDFKEDRWLEDLAFASALEIRWDVRVI